METHRSHHAKRVSRAARQAKIIELISSEQISSQAELAALLAGEGIVVSQGTLSKDLVEISAVRIRNGEGDLVYAISDSDLGSVRSEAKLERVCREILLTVASSANLVVMKTPPGAAQYFASVIDKVSRDDILGTIAGDDTVMVIAADIDAGQRIEQWFSSLAGREKEVR